MTDNHRYNHFVIFALILIVGLGFALTLPWLANEQGLAAQSEVPAQDNAPTATRYYVAKTGDDSDGLNWDKAFTKLQHALTAAVEGGGGEIWVATGIYTPGTDQDDSFNLFPGVAVYGGFAGTETSLTERDWIANPTILSGDIDNNDTNTDGVVLTTNHVVGKNAYHVIWADGTTGTPITGSTILDGFIITAGKADGSHPHYHGGGFHCVGSGIGNECSPSLSNVTFSGNSADYYGGAMFNNGYEGTSSPRLRDVTFSGNSAKIGGAMYNRGGGVGGHSSPRLRDVTFSGNWTDSGGGAMYNGGDNNGSSGPQLSNVTFSGNSAGSNGGAILNDGYNGYSSPLLTNVTFSGNSAGNNGGAMYNDGSFSGSSNPVLRNTILYNNRDISGTGTISATIYNNSAATTFLVHCLAQGTGDSSNWTSDTSYINIRGNIDQDPKFITPVNPNSAPTTSGNLRLQPISPAIDVGDNALVAGMLTDLDGAARIQDGDGNGTAIVDMGAYEAATHFQLTVIKAGTGKGLVVSSPPGIDCGVTCSLLLKENSSITLIAGSDADSTFTGWSGNCSGSGNCVVTMDAPKSVTAKFEQGSLEPDLSNYLPLINR